MSAPHAPQRAYGVYVIVQESVNQSVQEFVQTAEAMASRRTASLQAPAPQPRGHGFLRRH